MDTPLTASASVCDFQLAISRVVDMPQEIINKANEIYVEMHQRAFNLTKQAFRLCSVTSQTLLTEAPKGGLQ